jgi:hypothetical protein
MLFDVSFLTRKNPKQHSIEVLVENETNEQRNSTARK